MLYTCMTTEKRRPDAYSQKQRSFHFLPAITSPILKTFRSCRWQSDQPTHPLNRMDIDSTALLLMLLKNQAMLETIYESQSHIIARLESREQEEVYSEMLQKQELIEERLMQFYRDALALNMPPPMTKGQA